MTHCRLKSQGFTLIELLIAMVIAAIIGILLTFSVQKFIQYDKALKKHTTRWEQLTRSFNIIANDIHNCQPPIYQSKAKHKRIEFTPPLLYQSKNNFTLIRHTLLMVNQHQFFYVLTNISYGLTGEQLYRTIQFRQKHLDILDSKQLLLRHVRKIQWQFISNTHRHYGNWPISNKQKSLLPTAVALQLTLDNGKTYTRWFQLYAQ